MVHVVGGSEGGENIAGDGVREVKVIIQILDGLVDKCKSLCLLL